MDTENIAFLIVVTVLMVWASVVTFAAVRDWHDRRMMDKRYSLDLTMMRERYALEKEMMNANKISPAHPRMN